MTVLRPCIPRAGDFPCKKVVQVQVLPRALFLPILLWYDTDMNRRLFLSGTGLLGIVTTFLNQSQGQDPDGVRLCDGTHVPDQRFVDDVALGMGQSVPLPGDDPGTGMRPLVPCQNCGVLFWYRDRT